MSKVDFKDAYEALEFASKQVIISFSGKPSINVKTKPISEEINPEEVVRLTEFDSLFIDLFGEEQFNKCPTIIDKINFVAERWDDLR